MPTNTFSPDTIRICIVESLIPRSSSHFFVPILDGHPELITGFSQYYPDESLINQIGDYNLSGLAQLVFSRWRQEIPEEYSLDCIPFSYIEWEPHFILYITKYGISRRNIFLALHYAIAESTGKEVSKIKWIVYHQHHFRYENFIKDFLNNVRVILTVRDPRAAFWSCRKSVVKDQLLHFIFYTKFRTNSCHYQFIPYEQLPIRHEDLHTDYPSVRKMVCDFLSVSDSPELDMATVFGHPWDGTHRDGACESNFKIRSTVPDKRFVTEEWREKLNWSDVFLIQLFLRGFMKRYGYNFGEKLRIP